MPITALPPAPSTADPTNFSAKGDALLLALVNTFVAEMNAAITDINSKEALAVGAGAVAQQALNAGLANAAANAVAAAASAAAAAGYAGLAQATDPATPVRVNPSEITANFALAAGYNGLSAGPVEIAEGVTVTIADNSTWSIT